MCANDAFWGISSLKAIIIAVDKIGPTYYSSVLYIIDDI